MVSYLIDSKRVPEANQEILTLQAPREATKNKETKDVSLGLSDPSKTTRIRAHLDPNRKACSSASYVPTHTCLHGNLQTCLGYHGS
jgi:hypothetical protein